MGAVPGIQIPLPHTSEPHPWPHIPSSMPLCSQIQVQAIQAVFDHCVYYLRSPPQDCIDIPPQSLLSPGVHSALRPALASTCPLLQGRRQAWCAQCTQWQAECPFVTQ
uniref:Uncharacterized protein n=1 Tax=Eutreptiella gymnastica TaxID=73025 RepID=A0A7S1NC46_9EUGL